MSPPQSQTSTQSHTLYGLFFLAFKIALPSKFLIYTLLSGYYPHLSSLLKVFLSRFFWGVGEGRLTEIYNPFIPSHSTCTLLSSFLSLPNTDSLFMSIISIIFLSTPNSYALLSFLSNPPSNNPALEACIACFLWICTNVAEHKLKGKKKFHN